MDISMGDIPPFEGDITPSEVFALSKKVLKSLEIQRTYLN
jgi:hypothetical protein